MQGWQTTYLGMRELPREISTFELQAFFTFGPAERELIEARRGNRLKLGLALHIGFLRMSGRLLDAFRVIPSVLWRHLARHEPCLARADRDALHGGTGVQARLRDDPADRRRRQSA